MQILTTLWTLLNLIIWTLVIVVIVKVLRKYLKNNNDKNDRIILPILVLILLSVSGCKKEELIVTHFSSNEEVVKFFKASSKERFSNKGNPILDTNIYKLNPASRPIIDSTPIPNPITQLITLSEIFFINGYYVNFTITNLAGLNGGLAAVPAGGTQLNTLAGGGIYAVSGITAGMTGITLGWGFTQTGSTYTNYPNSYLITIKIIGTQYMMVNTSGSGGSLWSMPVEIDIQYNVNTYDHSIHTYYPPR